MLELGTVTSADIQTARAYVLNGAPKPPSCSLGRLIVTSQANRSTEPPDSVRMAQAANVVRKLRAQRFLAVVAQQADTVQAINRRIKALERIR